MTDILLGKINQAAVINRDLGVNVLSSRRSAQSLPVLRHANNTVFFGDDDRRAYNILESLDLAQQTWLASLRLGLDFGRHESVDVHKAPAPVLAPGNITQPGPIAQPWLVAAS